MHRTLLCFVENPVRSATPCVIHALRHISQIATLRNDVRKMIRDIKKHRGRSASIVASQHGSALIALSGIEFAHANSGQFGPVKPQSTQFVLDNTCWKRVQQAVRRWKTI